MPLQMLLGEVAAAAVGAAERPTLQMHHGDVAPPGGEQSARDGTRLRKRWCIKER